jgi:lipopolysaccharide assembly outer membrane protein LptD (OstA)
MSKNKDKQTNYGGQKYLILGFLSFFCLCILAQGPFDSNRITPAVEELQKPLKQAPSSKSSSQKKVKKGKAKGKKHKELTLAERNRGKGLTRIDLIHADVAREDNFLYPDVEVLVGNVKLLHGHMYMFCDSALIHKKTNSVEAFDHVKMKQGDTLFIYGDYLHYDGISQIARLRGKVKMINRKTTLLTDSLNYDRVFNLAYYFEGGTVMDADNVLTSDWGEYSPASKIAKFNHEVKLVNPRFVLTSDTLKYSTRTKIATILGPSTIVSDKNVIHSSKGDYNTTRDQGWLFDRSLLTSGSKKLIGDSVYYDRKKGYGKAFHNVIMRDTLNKSILTGDYCFYNEKEGSAFATKKALAMDYSQKDTMYVHADTLYMRTFNQKTDSMYRIMRAYHKVRMYRNDVQGVCDSLVYITRDSCLTMYRDPIIWNNKQQLLGEVIHAYFNDTTITWAHIVNQALTVEQMDSIHYNQVTGKEIKAYFKNKELNKVDVISNVLLVYYPLDKDSTMMFMNTSETSLLNLYMKQKKMDKMVMSPKSEGVLYPMTQLPEDKMRLSNFAWFDYIRPKDKNDLFAWRGKHKDQILKQTQEDNPDMKNKSLRDLLK